MLTTTFSAKLDALPATIDLLRNLDVTALSTALEGGRGRHAIAIGSGGSAISAEYLARCRDTLGLGPTTVQTPMQIVLDAHDLDKSEVWLFTASANNPDVIAAARAAIDRRAAAVLVVTRNPEGAAVDIVVRGGGEAHVVPVADLKDGYLATHSLISTVATLLLASDSKSGEAPKRELLLDALLARLLEMRAPSTKNSLKDALGGLTKCQTIIVATDPLLRPTAVLLDTSIWEASLCHIQTTDIRNLAHGRHAWLHHRARETHILAIATADSRPIWSAIESVLPEFPRSVVLERTTGGRLDNALGIIDGLGVIEAIGAIIGIDPGKPGMGEFGRAVYEDSSLASLASGMPPRVRHKRAAAAKLDVDGDGGMPLHKIWRDRAEMLATANIGGVVFDYDGTLVATDRRWDPPTQPIVDEIVRLHRAGLKIGIATGRGGSAGEDLRKVLPSDVLRSILIGYYNGGHICAADIDLKSAPPIPDPAIQETAEWLHKHPELFIDQAFKVGGIQITVDMAKLRHRYRFPVDLAACPPVSSGLVRVAASGHSFDILPSRTTKLAVVETVQAATPGKAVLRFGDSGASSGNDHALLSHPFGISVGEVCGEPNGCWSLFGSQPTGPDALLKILRALISSDQGTVRLDVAALGLDSP